jgi:hypothetical protein
MPRARLSAFKDSITNRGPQSGGSVGGNDKAGLVSMWQFAGVTQSVIARRLPGDCCLKLEFQYSSPAAASAPAGSSSGSSGSSGGQVVF